MSRFEYGGFWFAKCCRRPSAEAENRRTIEQERRKKLEFGFQILGSPTEVLS